jgi:hypothetical protein
MTARACPFVVDQQSVGAFGVDAADEPFRIAVRPGRARRDLDHVDVLGAEDGVEGVGELGVPVADEEAERGGLVAQVREQVAGGLSGLGCGGVGGHPEQVHCASLDLHDDRT